MNNLIVTDTSRNKYRPTGQFREPKPGEFVYCFDHKRVEQRYPAGISSSVTSLNGIDMWCSFAHAEFLLHRIIVEPVAKPQFLVSAELAPDDFRALQGLPPALWGNGLKTRLHDAIRAASYRELQP